jgi:hypothetical protein
LVALFFSTPNSSSSPLGLWWRLFELGNTLSLLPALWCDAYICRTTLAYFVVSTWCFNRCTLGWSLY